MTEENMSFLRHAHISTGGGESVLDALAKIPGYQVVPVSESHSPDRTHMVVTPSGDQIHLVNGAAPNIAMTSNVIDQDRLPGRVPVQEDELVKLSKASRSVDGLSVSVAMSQDDLDSL